ncbi:PREDICTED: uncharacterized protein LOC109153840 [Ipomoea nil]|uniref:uncharacterized protein LOC109153840 n=1 Tax=Ipomoea nil TaxID=35883 RepID=UPI000901580A|nr:PREDICTED: uncharacterized protein LOC109153840 [Ipomoea nil]XP_019157260.1 PREDICTED: uncharacterized protein LOC109153840 [Ipomoea nil]XP_019157261.1 PREDICTED: uncharacterized protein LOC109153840 [Ipomoea nil]
MPVSGKEELAMQSSSSLTGIPIKKRRFPFVLPSSPPPEEGTSFHDESNLKNGESSSTQRSSFNPIDTVGCTIKSDVSKNPLLEVKQERPGGAHVSFGQPVMDSSGSKLVEADKTSVQSTEEPLGSILAEAAANITSAQINEESLESKVEVINRKICSGSTNSADNCVKGSLTESSLEVVENIPVNVKMENIGKQAEGNIKFQSSAHSGRNIELSLGPQRHNLPLGVQRHNLPLGVQNRGGSEMPNNLDTSLLSLSLNKEKAIDSQIGRSNSRSNDDSPDIDTNRSNWDLNITMDAWEGSGNGFQDTDNIDALSKISTRDDLKPSLSSFSMLGACSDKGKQICGVFEQISSKQSSKSEDSIFLSLGNTFHGLDFSKRQFGSMTKADSIPHTIPRTITNMNSVGCDTVKVEPIDESERGNILPVEFPIKCAEKLIEKKSIKSEPLQETNQESCRMSSMTLHQSVGNVVPSKESSSTLLVPLTPEKLLSARVATFSELSVSGELSNQSEHSVHTKEVYARNNALDQMNACIVIQNENSALKGLNSSCSKVDACELEGVKIDSLEMSQLKQVNEQHQALVASCEGSVSGEQDMNISVDMEEEQLYGSDYESDSNHACTVHIDEGRPCGKEDDDYEDGEVREPILQLTKENTIALGTDSKKNIDSGLHAMATSSNDNNVQSSCDEKDEIAMIHHEAINDCSKECGGDTVCDKIVDQVLGKGGSLSTSISENVPTCSYDFMPVNVTQQIHFDQAGAEDRQEENIEGVLGDGALDASNDMRVTVTKIEDANGTNKAEQLNSSLANAETPLNGNSARDSNAIKSRIINLPRTSNSTSPSKARSVMGRPLSSRSGRERYFDAQDERLHLSGNRGEMYTDCSNKYARERIRDRPYASSRVSFMRGRGRVSGRFGRSHRYWDSERDFSFTRRDDYCFPRHKRAAAIGDAEVERNDFDISPNGAVMGLSRGRKHLNGESPSFRHSSSRRLSPDRDGHATMGIQILGRMPRNSSPSRCIDEDGSEFVGLRHGERFVRNLPNDIIDPLYRSDGQFVRGKKFFPTIQRRDFSRMRSKSPDGSQRHSPGPWTSSHRRAMEGLDDLSELQQRRSPVMYRVDRMRSPKCDYFSEEIVPRRRGSPSYVARSSNNMRDVDAMQEHGHPNSLSSRSPNRLFPRNTRRADGVNCRERVDDDEYFSGPINSSRLHELRGDGSSDERRKFTERRGVRSFRPPYSNDTENFRFHPDGGPRNFGSSPEEDAEFMERTNTREREFDAHIETGPGIAPRRMRNMEEQEGNYRPQLWHGDGFNDASRLKRRRF